MTIIKFLLSIFLFEYLSIAVQAENSTFKWDNNIESITNEPLEYLPAPRIVGGQNAAENQFPYQVVVNSGNSVCGGTIISQNYILTAAHCVTVQRGPFIFTVQPSSVVVRAGTLNIISGGTVATVAEVKVHGSYRGTNNDIALLRLSKPITFSNSVRSVSLATDSLASGTPVVVSGWGALRAGGQLSPRLQYVTLTALTTSECRRRLRNVNDSILCLAHQRGTGVCHGDSGGPAVSNGRLVGVANFVINTCATTTPDGYAKVAYHFNWIRNNSDV